MKENEKHAMRLGTVLALINCIFVFGITYKLIVLTNLPGV